MNRQPKLVQQRAITVLVFISVAVLYLQGRILPHSTLPYANEGPEAIESDAQLHRYLLQSLDESHFADSFDYDYPTDDHSYTNESSPIGTNNHENLAQYKSYTLLDAINEASTFKYCFAVLIYDPSDDIFYAYYSKNHLWRSNFRKLHRSIEYLTYILRHTFPERFTKHVSPEFALAISSGDYPHVDIHKIPHLDGKAPVLQFGSAFRELDKLFPNMVAMPMPSGPSFLRCFAEWVKNSGDRVCEDFAKFAQEQEHEFEQLEPQLIWRGTDFGYLELLIDPMLSQPFGDTIEHEIGVRQAAQTSQRDKMRVTTEVLREHYDELLPRWKGAVLTAEAELEADDGQNMPWANIKFSRYLDGGIKRTSGSAKYRKFEDVGVAVDEYMSHEESGRYKYQIDLAGGGGTTWTGTISKLAMPGVLFHHISPMKDYFYDRLEPWKHFIPVKTDLSDLKDKVAWANNHPAEAQRIANEGTAFAKHFGTPEGFEQMFQEDVLNVLRHVIDAYEPLEQTDNSWRDILDDKDSNMVRVLSCSGHTTIYGACRLVGEGAGGVVDHWVKSGNYPHDIELLAKLQDSRVQMSDLSSKQLRKLAASQQKRQQLKLRLPRGKRQKLKRRLPRGKIGI